VKRALFPLVRARLLFGSTNEITEPTGSEDSVARRCDCAGVQVCMLGAQENIGFHIRVPFKANLGGMYTFRMHADYGLDSFLGAARATVYRGALPWYSS
jgi:hypothetical protein